MENKRKGAKEELTLFEGLSRIPPKDLKITLNKSECIALKKAFTEEEEARKTNFVLRGAIRR